MNKLKRNQAFTLVELMVSIFVTISVIASFYKLYEISGKTERSTTVRVSVDLLGNQILNTIEETLRFIGINSQKGDFEVTIDSDNGILRTMVSSESSTTFEYVSVYGSPITKLNRGFEDSSVTVDEGETSEACSGVEHIQSVSAPESDNDTNTYFYHTQYGVLQGTRTGLSREKLPTGLSGKLCKDILPAGTLVSGKSSLFKLYYGQFGDNKQVLNLSYDEIDDTGVAQGAAQDLIRFEYEKGENNNDNSQNVYSIPKFVTEFLTEVEESGVKKRQWLSSVIGGDSGKRQNVIAVRFGFIILSKKKRLDIEENSENTQGMPKYCIFETSEDSCYSLQNPNYTASVFKRTV